LSRLSNDRVRELVEDLRRATGHGARPEVLKALGSDDAAVQLEMVRLAGRLKLPGAPDGMGPLLEKGDRELKLVVVEALTTIGSPNAMRLLEKAIDDGDRDVRIGAVKFLGQRGTATRFAHRGGGARHEAERRGLDGKMTFFEAYGASRGRPASPTGEAPGPEGGLLARKEDPETARVPRWRWGRSARLRRASSAEGDAGQGAIGAGTP